MRLPYHSGGYGSNLSPRHALTLKFATGKLYYYLYFLVKGLYLVKSSYPHENKVFSLTSLLSLSGQPWSPWSLGLALGNS